MTKDTTLNTYVLLVEDDKVNRLICKKYLEKMGISVDLAENGKQAISKCRDNTYNLIIMDMEMPLMGGLDATQKIREKSLSFAPIIALTANDNEASRRLCKHVGMNGFITKPIVQDDLVREVQKVLK